MDALRDALPPADSPRFWRALDELAADPVRRGILSAAMPQLASMAPSMDRRGFLKLLGASLAFAGLTACSGPPPEHIVAEPGGDDTPLPETARYATALDLGGDVVGTIATLRDGRPIKLDGNPRHPASLGGSDPRLQAAILDLWDPGRSDAPRLRGRPSSWGEVEAQFAVLRERYARDGRGLHLLTGTVNSPTLARQREAFLQAFPGASWHIHEPIPPQGASVDLARAKVIVMLDADPLATWSGHIAMARSFAEARNAGARVYAIEATPSLSGRNADHLLPVPMWQLPRVSAALRALLDGKPTHDIEPALLAQLVHIAEDLRANVGAAVMLINAWSDAAVRADVAAIQAHIGQPPGGSIATPPPASLLDATERTRIETLIVMDTNPGYSMPGFVRIARDVPAVLHLGRYRDETAALAQWHLPALHPLEIWSDLRAADGTVAIVQPVLAPLVDGRSSHDLLAMLLGDQEGALQRLRRTWPSLDDEAWHAALQRGVVPGTVGSPDAGTAARPASTADGHPTAQPPGTLEVVFRPDPNTWDGRHAGNAWLQELPRTVTSLAWGNALLISPALARERGLADGDVVRLELDGRAIEGPVLGVPGQATHTVTVLLGGGRREGLGAGYGYDGYALRAHDAQWYAAGARLTPLGRHETLALTQAHQDMGTRDAIRVVTPDAPAIPTPRTPPSFYPESKPGSYRWAMSIDLGACIGCNACTVACQSENNIPVVGKTEVARGRRMHWIRVDSYFEGTARAPRAYHQPVPCMHCEHAPCEVVCPVEATVHDSEGLNLQVYNRCIGTRFCANNCPYKVRRFNFLQYADLVTESLKAMRNPEVTVREKGVMEKCTYCVQRIEGAHAAAIREQRLIGPAEVTTACQDACPAGAIVFGQLDAPTEALAAARASSRRYVLLEELNTRPRTTYLAASRHPHPNWSET